MNPKQLAHKERELAKLSAKIRVKGFSLRTEQSYVPAVAKFIDYICARRWAEGATSEQKFEHFLTYQAVERDISASTQMVLFHAVCFYYREVRNAPLQNVDALRAKRGEQVRQAPSREDTRKILMAVADSGPYPTRLICHLICACGLRLEETLSIRLKDLDLEAVKLTIIAGKGKKDRFINLPPSLIERLRTQVREAEAVHHRAVQMGVPVKLPHRYAEKNRQSAHQRRWFWLFPQMQPCDDPRGGGRVWWHCLDKTVQRALRTANRRAGTEGITPHSLRHAWATQAHANGAHVRDIQEVMGHKDIETTMRYLRPDPERVPSPFEALGIVA